MKTTQELSEASGCVYEVHDYGEVKNENILTIFGDEMSFNDLRDKSKNEYDYTNLVIELYDLDDNNRRTMVYFNDVMVLEIIRSMNYCSIMSYQLRELDNRQADEEEDEDEK